MRRIYWLLGALCLAVAGMAFIHGWQARQVGADAARVNALWERQEVARDMTLALERYRRTSTSFRKMSEAEITAAKNGMKQAIARGTESLARLDPLPEEKALGDRLNQQVSDFMVLSAKLEPMLFLRDVFLKPEARAAHDQMQATIEKLRDSAKQRQLSFRSGLGGSQARWTRAFYALGILVIALFLSAMAIMFFAYVRPLRPLRGRVKEVEEGKLRRESGSRLRGVFAEVERAIDQLAWIADSQRREKHQFVTAIANDLRSPLVPLQTSATLLAAQAEKLSPEQRHQAAEQVRRSVLRLNRTMDDLADTLQVESGKVRLEERVVDLRESLNAVAGLVNGPGSMHQVRVFAPTLPVWALVDGARIERVLLALAGKIMQYSPQGGQIDLALSSDPRRGPGGALEISVHQGNRDATGVMGGRDAGGLAGGYSGTARREAARPSGPEQELLRHWVSENGFGMALAQRLMEAHGGGITAAGVAGTNVVFTVRLPEERLAGSFAGAPGLVGGAESAAALPFGAGRRLGQPVLGNS
jgi:signal transduction histidine kinase